jgi:hypothetical protein
VSFLVLFELQAASNRLAVMTSSSFRTFPFISFSRCEFVIDRAMHGVGGG